MRRSLIETSFLLVIVLISFSFIAVHSSAREEEKQENKLTPQSPQYELKLNLNEFSVLNSSIMGGLQKYGGGADFCLRMTKEAEEIVWTVTITDPKLIEVLTYWAAEKSAELVNSLNVDSLDAQSKLALNTVKSLNQKIAYAKDNPVWDAVRLSGLVVQDSGSLFIESNQGRFQVTSKYLTELSKRIGKRVIAIGFIKTKGQIEMTAFLEKKENTLELFVMSYCPFARMAESSLLHFLDTYSGKPKPSLELHYIFYKKSDGGKMVFTSMHGEEEIKENLVQMVIRDKHPLFYHDYLLRRIANNDASWDTLAREIGMKREDMKSIEQTIEAERNTLIQQEYDYVTGTYGIYDGSPNYVWESERVANIREVEAFKDLTFSLDKCSDKTKLKEGEDEK